MSQNSKPRKAGVNSEAAKILERYRNANKPMNPDGTPIEPGEGGQTAPLRPTSPPPSQQRRSGTRGK